MVEKICKQPCCGCDYEKRSEEDEDLSYCTDTVKPILCEVPDIKCKWPNTLCEHKVFTEDDEDEENPLCYAIREGVTECPLKLDDAQGPLWSLQETLDRSPFWNLNGFHYYKEKIIVDEKVLKAIKGWAGDCTEPAMSDFKDPEAMYAALDLIYKLIDTLEEKSVDITIKPRFDREGESIHLDQFVTVNNGELGSTAKSQQLRNEEK